jgi:hypothetical protein
MSTKFPDVVMPAANPIYFVFFVPIVLFVNAPEAP